MSSTTGSDRRLAITHITTFYPPTSFGGDGVHVHRLAAAQARRGHDVRVLHAPRAFRLLNRVRAAESRECGRAAGVDVRAIDGQGGVLETLLVHQSGGPVLSRRRLERMILPARPERTSVVHFHNVSLVAGLRGLSLGTGVKLYTPHEYWLVCPTHMLFRYNREICRERTCLRCVLRARRPPQLWRHTTLRDRCLSHVDRMLYPSAVTRRVYREHGVEHAGEILPHFLPDEYVAAALRRGVRDASAAAYFLYAGRLDAVKGVDTLLRYFTREAFGAPLWLAGDGPDGKALRRRYGSHPAVRFLGHCDADTLGALYRDAVGLLMPSAGYEIFGQVVAEAFAHGTPVLVSPIGGGAGLVEASGGGAVFHSGDELVEATARWLADPEERDRLGRRGRQFAERELSEAIYMSRYEGIVREVAG